MKRWLWRAVAVGLVLAIGGFVVAASGLIPLKASSGHWPVTEWMLRFGMKRSIATHSLRIQVPDNLEEPSLILKGAGHYDVGCRTCHGEPGGTVPRIAARMLPPPPELASRIRDSNPRKLFYVVKHGLKFTGMPAWPASDRDDEIWAVVAFLLKYPDLDAESYRELAGRARGSTALRADPEPAQKVSRTLLESCAQCHGEGGHGRGNAAFPKLAGQRAEYFGNALRAYATGRRHSGIMEPVAAALSSEAMDELAHIFSRERSESRITSSVLARAVDSAAVKRGERIAQEGIVVQRVPACVECHGSTGRKRKPEYPLLAGQFAGYLELQLTLFKEERRGGTEYAHLMRPIAARLTPEQMREVSLYFASLPSAP